MPWRFNPFTGNLDETDIPAFNGEVTLGSAASPSIFFTGDTNTGIYSPGADQLALSTNGTGRLFVDASGNVGIGSATPVNSANYSSLTLQGTTGGQIALRAGTTLKSYFYNDASKTTLGAVDDFVVATTGSITERLRIDSSGRLLVGTSSSSDLASIVLEGYAGGGANAPSIAWFKRKEIASTITAGDGLGLIRFGSSDSGFGAEIAAQADSVWSSTGDAPTRLVFSVTADGSASPTEALRISSNRAITVSDGGNVVLGTTTGTKIGTATTQKLGFYNATPVVQPAAVADATDAATVITQLNDLLAKLRTLGIIAT